MGQNLHRSARTTEAVRRAISRQAYNRPRPEPLAVSRASLNDKR